MTNFTNDIRRDLLAHIPKTRAGAASALAALLATGAARAGDGFEMVSENERVALAAQALRAGDVNALGRLLNLSHASLRDLYRTTGVEADTLVNISQNHPACLGSRLTGGGFGGCTVSLVKREMAQCFKSEVTEEYSVRTGLEPVCYDVISDDGLTIER